MKGPITNGSSASSAAAVNASLASKNGSAAENLSPPDLLVNPLANVQSALEKKLRNLGKRTQKLQQIKADFDNGTKLTEMQVDAISKAGEVEQQVEFVKDMQKLVVQQLRQYQKASKQREDARAKKAAENNVEFLKTVLKYQEVLKVVNREDVKTVFANDPASPKMTAEETIALERIRQDFSTSLDAFTSFSDWDDQLSNVAEKMQAISVGSDKEIENNLTGARAKNLINGMVGTSVFQSFQFSKSVDELDSPAKNQTTILAGEETETDESSLNDFHQDSIDSNNGVDQPSENSTVQVTNESVQQTAENTVVQSEANCAAKNIQSSTETSSVENSSLTSVDAHANKVSESTPENGSSPTPETNSTASALPKGDSDKKEGDSAANETKNAGEKPTRRRNNQQRYRKNRNNFQGDRQQDGEKAGEESKEPKQQQNQNTVSNYKKRNSVGGTNAAVNNSSEGKGVPKPEENAQRPARRSEQPARRYNPHDRNESGTFSNNTSSNFVARRPYPVPRNNNNQYGGNGQQQNQTQQNVPQGPSQYRNYNNSNNNNYEHPRQPRVHQPYEYGLRFAY